MSWWEDHDQAVGLANSLDGTEDASLLAGSAVLMLHAAGRRALNAEAHALSTSRAGLPKALANITGDSLTGCISKSLSDAAGKPMYGPFRAAAIKAAADEGAITLVDILVAAKVPYRDAVAASARSYGIEKRDALTLSRVIKADPATIAASAASQRALLLWATATAGAEMGAVSKEEDEFFVDGIKRVVNRDGKGRFARKGAAESPESPAKGSQEEYDQWIAQQRERGRQRRSAALPIAQAQALGQAKPPAEQERKQERRVEQEQQVEAEQDVRVQQQRDQELKRLGKLRELRRFRAMRGQRAAQVVQQEESVRREQQGAMLNEASRRAANVAIGRARFAELMAQVEMRQQYETELASAQEQLTSRERLIAEAADIATQNAAGILRNIAEGESGYTFNTADPINTSYIQEVRFLNRGLVDSVNLHVPLMFKPHGEMGFADYPDDDDVFRMYTGKPLPRGKSLADLEPGDEGYIEFLMTADIVRQLHQVSWQKGHKHPLQALSLAFDSHTGRDDDLFFKGALEQYGIDADKYTWWHGQDGNDKSFRVLAAPGTVRVLDGKSTFSEYLLKYGANVTDDGETYIYQPGLTVMLDAAIAEQDMRALMEESDTEVSDQAWRAYAIYQLTRTTDVDASAYRDYKFAYPSQFTGFIVDRANTDHTIIDRLVQRGHEDGIDYLEFSSPEAVIIQDFVAVLSEMDIPPSDIAGEVYSAPAIPMYGDWDDQIVDVFQGLLHERNYKDRHKGMTEDGQGWKTDHEIDGVAPLWSVKIRNDVKGAAADLEQAEAALRSANMGSSNISAALRAIEDIKNRVEDIDTDPQSNEDFIDNMLDDADDAFGNYDPEEYTDH